MCIIYVCTDKLFLWRGLHISLQNLLHFKTGTPNQQYINIPKSGVDGIVACVISYHGFKVNPYLEMLTVL